MQRHRETGAHRQMSKCTDCCIWCHAVADPHVPQRATFCGVYRWLRCSIGADIVTPIGYVRFAVQPSVTKATLNSQPPLSPLLWFHFRVVWGAEWNSVVSSDKSWFCFTTDWSLCESMEVAWSMGGFLSHCGVPHGPTGTWHTSNMESWSGVLSVPTAAHCWYALRAHWWHTTMLTSCCSPWHYCIWRSSQTVFCNRITPSLIPVGPAWTLP